MDFNKATMSGDHIPDVVTGSAVWSNGGNNGNSMRLCDTRCNVSNALDILQGLLIRRRASSTGSPDHDVPSKIRVQWINESSLHRHQVMSDRQFSPTGYPTSLESLS